MKNNSFGLIAGLLFGAVSSSPADTSNAYEGFAYPDGPLNGLNGGIGFSNAWVGPTSFLVLPGSFSNGGPTSGGHLQPGEGTISRRLSVPIGTPGTTQYLSIQIRIVFQPNLPPPDRFGLVLKGPTGTGLFVGRTNVGNFNWILENAAGGSAVAGPGINIFGNRLVIKCEFFAGNDRFTLYVDPVAGQPEPASGTVKFNSDAGSITNISFTVLNNGFGLAHFDELRLASTYADAVPALPSNNAPTLANQIPDQDASYGSSFNYTFPDNTFNDTDAGQTLSYSASGLPPGINFDGPTRTFSGAPTNADVYAIIVTATDSGTPQLSTNDTFNITVANALLVVSASSTNRPYGEANPTFTGTLVGITNGDNLTATFDTTATPNSSPGDYPITPILQDPDSRLGNYTVSTNLGILTVNGVTLEFSLSGGSPSFCWPTNAADFGLEYADSLTPPIDWQPVTSGLTTNGSTICIEATPVPETPTRFYRLNLP